MFSNKTIILKSPLTPQEIIHILEKNLIKETFFNVDFFTKKHIPFLGNIQGNYFKIKAVKSVSFAPTKGIIEPFINGSQITLTIKPLYSVFILTLLPASIFWYFAYKNYLGDGKLIINYILQSIIPFVLFVPFSFLLRKKSIELLLNEFSLLFKTEPSEHN